LQPPTDPLLQTTYTQAAAVWLHPCGFPYLAPDMIDLGVIADGHIDALVGTDSDHLLFELCAGYRSGCGVEAAVDARPAFGRRAFQIQFGHYLPLVKALLPAFHELREAE